MELLPEAVCKGRHIAALFILAPFYVLSVLAVVLNYLFNKGPLAQALIRCAERVAGER